VFISGTKRAACHGITKIPMRKTKKTGKWRKATEVEELSEADEKYKLSIRDKWKFLIFFLFFISSLHFFIFFIFNLLVFVFGFGVFFICTSVVEAPFSILLGASNVDKRATLMDGGNVLIIWVKGTISRGQAEIQQLVRQRGDGQSLVKASLFRDRQTSQ